MSVQGGNIEKLLGKIADGIGDLKTNINQMNQDLKTKLDVLISRVDRKSITCYRGWILKFSQAQREAPQIKFH